MIEHLSGGEMHWFKWMVESWIFLGLTTAILGIFWTNRESRKLNSPITAAPPKLGPTFSAKNLPEARSA
jgi:hypothetical protein